MAKMFHRLLPKRLGETIAWVSGVWIVKNEVGLWTTGMCSLGFVFEILLEMVAWIFGG